MRDEPLFTGKDLELIQSLIYDPKLEPGFELIRGCLIWSDERPNGVTPGAWDTLGSLWGARASIHQDLPFSAHSLDPEHTRRVWEQAQKEIPDWPGFKRLKLSAKDKAYLERELAVEEY